MATKITTDILESYLQCRYKSHLKLVGEQGTPSDYERLLQGARARVRLMATDKLLSQYGASEILRSLTVALSTYCRPTWTPGKKGHDGLRA
jgi:hypothetical protein